MMILHNYGNRIPVNAAYTGSTYVWAANGHPAFPGVVETNTTTIQPGAYTTDAPFKYPPSGLMASMITKTLRLSASLTAGGQSISVSSESVPYQFGGVIETIADRMTPTGAGGVLLYYKSEVGDGEDLSLTVSMGRLSNVTWNISDGKWVWPMYISASYRTFFPNPVDLYIVGRGEGSSFSPDFEETGVTATIFGETISLYGKTSDDLGQITGTITVDAEEYLYPL
jgi:hypothetical protein